MFVAVKQPNNGLMLPLTVGASLFGLACFLPSTGAPSWVQIGLRCLVCFAGLCFACEAFKYRRPPRPALVFDATGLAKYTETGIFSEPRKEFWGWDELRGARVIDWQDGDGHWNTGVVLQLQPNAANSGPKWIKKLYAHDLKSRSGQTDLGDNLVCLEFWRSDSTPAEIAKWINDSVGDPGIRQRWGDPEIGALADSSNPT